MSKKTNIYGDVVSISDGQFNIMDASGGHHSEARVTKIPYGAGVALTNPVVTACMSETDHVGGPTNAKTWGFILFCSNITPTTFDLVVRVPLNEPDVTKQGKGLKVNWIAVGD